MEWYVIDTRTNTIFNCVRNHGTTPPDIEWTVPYRYDTNPPREMLEAYRYWNERP